MGWRQWYADLRESWAHRRAGRPVRTRFVREVIPRHGVGIELGVQYGDFSAELLELAEPRRLHLVDVWYLAGKEWSWEATRDRSTVNALKRVLGRFEDALVSGQVVLHIDTDLHVVASLPDGYLDWAYVDTVHEHEHVTALLELLKTKVHPRGVIAGDDWVTDPEHRDHGVHTAVTAFVAREPYELVYAGERDIQWAIRRRSAPAGGRG